MENELSESGKLHVVLRFGQQEFDSLVSAVFFLVKPTGQSFLFKQVPDSANFNFKPEVTLADFLC